MSAGSILQAGVARALSGLPGLSGVFDGPPARASYPYAIIDAGLEADWSHKSGEGREVSVAVTLWDEQPQRLRQLADDAERELRTISVAESWQLVSVRFVRRRLLRDVAGPWAAALDFRARLLAAD